MNRAPNLLNVRFAFLCTGEEMKDRAIVPDVKVLVRQNSVEDVPFQPCDATSRGVSQAVACPIDRGSRQIEDCDVGVTPCNELVHQEGISTADVQDLRIFGKARALDEIQGSLRVRLEPAQAGRSLR